MIRGRSSAAEQDADALRRGARSATIRRGAATYKLAAQAEAATGAGQQEAATSRRPIDKKARPRTKKLKAAREALEKAKKKVAAPGRDLHPAARELEGAGRSRGEQQRRRAIYPATSTGRRLAFAQWIADRRNPLTARVLVNHVWLRHFGAPLVADVSDFGRRAAAPLHQDVLDTLAVGFMEDGWSIKQLHRTMVLSELYARSSSNAGADPPTLAADPDNNFYWRMNPRRMESQVVRDSLLQIAGRLDPTIGGPSLDAVAAETSPRRSLYFTQNADIEHRFLATFDNANVLECYRRNESVVPQQALALTNSKLSRDCADALAAKLQPLDDDAFIREAFLTVLGRAPDRGRAAREPARSRRAQRVTSSCRPS